MGRSLLGELEHLLLVAILRLEDDAYGAAIIAEIEARTGRELSQAACYIALQRLEAKGLIAGSLGDATAERGGRPKKFFRLNQAGSAKLRESANALFEMWDGVDAVAGPKARGR